MNFGLALDFGGDAGGLRNRLSNLAPVIALGGSAGFDSVWTGQSANGRHAAGSHTTSPLLLLAALSQHTDLALGTGVALMPAWHPTGFANDAALLQELLPHQLFLGVALGDTYVRRSFSVPRQEVSSWADRWLRDVEAQWPEHMPDKGSASRPTDQCVSFSRNRPALLLGGRASKAIERAARFADGYYADTTYSVERLSIILPKYFAAVEQRRSSIAQAPTVAVNRLTVTRKGGAQARRIADEHFTTTLNHYAQLGHLGKRVDREAVAAISLVGSPTDVRSAIELYASLGVTRINLRVAPRDMPIAEALATVETFGSEVLPSFA